MENVRPALPFLERGNIRYRLIEHTPVVTIADVEQLLGIPREVMVKTLIFERPDVKGYVVAAVRGTDRVNSRRLAEAVGYDGDLDLLDAARVEEVTGLPFGGIRPFGYDERFQVVIDRAVVGNQTVFCSAGTRTQTVIIAVADLIQISGGKVADIRARKSKRQRESE